MFKRALLIAGMLAVFVFPANASAGRLLATGHDADSHCSLSDPPAGQCHFVNVAVNYVRAGGPNPGRPMLLLDCSSQKYLSAALSSAGIAGGHVTMCPSKGPEFKGEPLTTSRYSAIVVGSSTDQLNIGSVSTAPDSLAINSRASSITAFFNQGGGILAFSGDANADGDPAIPDVYYTFLPIGVGARNVNPPFTLTPVGQGLGFQDSHNGIGTSDDINCCPTHNSFSEPPAGSTVQVAERDAIGAPETLIAEGTIGPATIVAGPQTGQVIVPPSSKRCLRTRSIRIRIKQPANTRVSRATIYVNGKRKKRIKRKSFGDKPSISVRIRRLPRRGIARIKVVVRTTNGVTHRSTKKYRMCVKKKRSRKKSSNFNL
jgi:hypothetical protein